MGNMELSHNESFNDSINDDDHIAQSDMKIEQNAHSRLKEGLEATDGLEFLSSDSQEKIKDLTIDDNKSHILGKNVGQKQDQSPIRTDSKEGLTMESDKLITAPIKTEESIAELQTDTSNKLDTQIPIKSKDTEHTLSNDPDFPLLDKDISKMTEIIPNDTNTDKDEVNIQSQKILNESFNNTKTMDTRQM